MDSLTRQYQEYYSQSFEKNGATAKGVEWPDEQELQFRYDKMLAVLQRDIDHPPVPPSLLDVGCGWGGLYQAARAKEQAIHYTGIDVVEAMILYGRTTFPEATFLHGDVFALNGSRTYDYVVCNGILTKKLTATIPEMETYARRLICKMFDLCRYGIAFNMMSTRVNFMALDLYYQNPLELLCFCLTEISPKVRLDHGYSSLQTGRGRLYEFTTYVYKD